MTNALLEVRELRKVFTRRHGVQRHEYVAVDDVSFEVTAGGCLAIVGESGSGKTTTARIVAGLETADGGTVSVDGQPVLRRGRRARSRDVQMVFQDPFGSLDPRQGVGAAIDEVLRVRTDLDRRSRRARVAELLEQVGLDERAAGQLPRGLSGGQRQRVAIAKALAADPRLLILDEAVSALDVSVQAQVLNVLVDLRRTTEVSYLFVSHDLAVVRQVSDACLVMRNGQVVEYGPTEQILTDPRDDYTAQLIEAIPRPGWQPRLRTADDALI